MTPNFNHKQNHDGRYIVLFISLLFITNACATPKLSYTSGVGDPEALKSRANISVRINESGLSNHFSRKETKESIVNAIKSDLTANLFSSGDVELDVRVTIEKLVNKGHPKLAFMEVILYPLWPLWLIGLPMDKLKSETIVSLEILTDSGEPISTYRTHKSGSNWVSLYKGGPGSLNSTSKTLKRALEDIKTQILNDRVNIANAIQKEKDKREEKRTGADDFDPPLITLIKPSISRGMKKIVRAKILTVRGRAVDKSGIYEVRINGISAQLLEDGNFWEDVNLLRGENQVEILAIDNLGNRATKRFTVVRKSTSPGDALAAGIDTELVTGKYYAMVIGINNYSGEWMPLQNAVHDAKSVAEELTANYHFDQIIELYDEDATRANIIRKLEWLADNLKEDDNLLIYYSGHGEFKENLNKGYWVPVDSKGKSTVNYISNSNLQTFLSGIPAQHTLLVSDACFSGDIFRSRTETISLDDYDNINRYYREVNRRMSRQALTSGGIEPVMDGGREGHSVFTYYFLKALKQNENKYFDAAQVFEQLKIPVANNSEQTPILQAVKNTGDEGGQFIFIRK